MDKSGAKLVVVTEVVEVCGINLVAYLRKEETMAIALDNLRVGRVYYLVNYGERRELEVLARLTKENFKVKDLDTLEIYELDELLRWGIGKDYELEELR
ncbi:hypothetical protein GCM10028791_19450 [Echinicola sediminis]